MINISLTFSSTQTPTQQTQRRANTHAPYASLSSQINQCSPLSVSLLAIHPHSEGKERGGGRKSKEIGTENKKEQRQKVKDPNRNNKLGLSLVCFKLQRTNANVLLMTSVRHKEKAVIDFVIATGKTSLCFKF